MSSPQGHHSFAENVQAFSDIALGEQPPRADVPRGHPRADVLPSATGRPAGVLEADGRANLRADGTVKAAGAPAQAGTASRKRPDIRSYTDDQV